MIPFNVPPYVGKELEYITQAVNLKKICGDGIFTKKCNEWIENKFSCPKALLTCSGSAALDISSFLCDLSGGGEVILPSYTFTSTANALLLAGAKLVFVDIRPDTMNIDENLIEVAITPKTRAIMVVHYAGVSCEMDKIMSIAKKYNLKVIEDAAQAVMSKYKDKYLGTIGDFGCYSFHETKNYSMGEGGAVVINDPSFILKAEILREKGTNRSQFYRGEVDKYTWLSFGDSYLPSELNAAYLFAQLEKAEEVNNYRLNCWNYYNEALSDLKSKGFLKLPYIPKECTHNAHMFYIKTSDLTERTKLIEHLKRNEIYAVFHYVPLHSSPAGLKYGRFNGEDIYTTKESEKLVRLPMYYGLTEEEQGKVINTIKSFYL